MALKCTMNIMSTMIWYIHGTVKQAEIEAIDEVSQTKIQQILHEKDDRLQNLIEHEQHEGQES